MHSPLFSTLAALQNPKTVQVLRENGVLYVYRGIAAISKPYGMGAQDTKRHDVYTDKHCSQTGPLHSTALSSHSPAPPISIKERVSVAGKSHGAT